MEKYQPIHDLDFENMLEGTHRETIFRHNQSS